MPTRSHTNIVIQTYAIPHCKSNMIVFIDGRFSLNHSKIHSPELKLIVSPINQLKTRYPESFHTLSNLKNEKLKNIEELIQSEGIFIQIPKGKTCEIPIQIIYLHTENNTGCKTKNIVYLEKHANAHIVETIVSIHKEHHHKIENNNIYYCDTGASLEIYRYQPRPSSILEQCNTTIIQKNESTVRSHMISLYGNDTNNDFKAYLEGENSEIDARGFSLLSGKQSIKNDIHILHKTPNSISNQLFKNILDDTAKALFTGKIYVEKDAQKVESYQLNKNILLSDEARSKSVPQLEIYADDVKCSHGSTTGSIDKEELTYLRCRGISERKAKSLLLHAFSTDILKNIHHIPIRKYFCDMIHEKLITFYS